MPGGREKIDCQIPGGREFFVCKCPGVSRGGMVKVGIERDIKPNYDSSHFFSFFFFFIRDYCKLGILYILVIIRFCFAWLPVKQYLLLSGLPWIKKLKMT